MTAGKICRVCGNPIEASSRTGKCRLCEIGLTPTARLQRDFSPLDASGRTLSGCNCPGCQAELSMADLSKRSCSICGSAFNPESLDTSLNVRESVREETYPQFKTISDA